MRKARSVVISVCHSQGNVSFSRQRWGCLKWAKVAEAAPGAGQVRQGWASKQGDMMEANKRNGDNDVNAHLLHVHRSAVGCWSGPPEPVGRN